jgi:hypothetical protein
MTTGEEKPKFFFAPAPDSEAQIHMRIFAAKHAVYETKA